MFSIKDRGMEQKLFLLEKEIAELAKNYRASWKEELWESEDSEEFGLNEFLGGKAEGFEDCLDLIRDHLKGSTVDIDGRKYI